MPVDGLIGRDQESDVLLRALADARAGRSRSVVIRGAAGIGKSALLAEARTRADGFVVTTTVGTVSDAQLTYAGLGDVIRPFFEHLDALPSPQAAALRGACRLGPSLTDDPFAAAAATLSLLAIASARTPVLVVIDDLQWLDFASAQALTFVARRLAAEPVCFLFAIRDGEHEAVGLSTFDELHLGPLPDDAARQLLREQAGASIPDSVATRIVRHAAGNPLALRELPAAMTTEQLAGLATTGPLLPVGDRVQQIYAQRIAGIDPSVRSALVVAAAAESGLAERVEEACSRLGTPTEAVTAAIGTGFLVRSGSRLRFRHPLARSAVYHLAPRTERREAHQALAGIAAARGDHELQSWHLFAAADGPDESVATSLETIALNARAVGGHASAAVGLRRSAAMSERPHDQIRRLVTAAESTLVCGRARDAVALVEEAARLAAQPDELAEVVTLQGRLALYGGVPMADAIDRLECIAHDPGTSRDTAARLLADASTLAIYARQTARAVHLAEEACRRADGTDPVTEAVAATTLGIARTFSGRQLASDHLLESYRVVLAASRNKPTEGVHQLQRVVVALGAQHRHADAAREAQRFIAAAREVSAVGVLPMALCLYANFAFWGGTWDGGTLAAAEARQLAETTEQPPMVLWALVCQTLFASARGEGDACREAASAALELMAETGVETFRTTVLCALGALALVEGNAGDAAGHFEQAYGIVAEFGPVVLVQWKADYIEALLALGRRTEAEQVAEALVVRAREPNARWERAVLTRARALLDGGCGAPVWAPAIATSRELPNPFPLARVELAWADRLAAAGDRHAAREQALSALRVFDRYGATAWSDRAVRLLHDIGIPHDRRQGDQLAALPPAVRQVTQMVAAGQPIDSVASQLFLGQQTVRRHLEFALSSLHIEDPAQIGAAEPGAEVGYRVRLLGGFEISRHDELVTISGMPAQAVKVVASAGGEIHADQLIETLWPDGDPVSGRSRLRNVLSRVRRAAGPLLQRQGEAVKLTPGTVVDIAAFEMAAAKAVEAADDEERLDWGRRGVELYAGDLLPMDRYADWTASPRERLRRLFVALLDQLAELARSRGDLSAASDWIERAIQSEPYADHRYVQLARVAMDSGHAGRAARLLDTAGRIASELGTPPPPTLHELRAWTPPVGERPG